MALYAIYTEQDKMALHANLEWLFKNFGFSSAEYDDLHKACLAGIYHGKSESGSEIHRGSISELFGKCNNSRSTLGHFDWNALFCP